MTLLKNPGQPDPQRIAVFRALQLGDLLNSAPALLSLRAAFPTAQITLIGLPWAQAFVERYRPLLDSFMRFPGYPGLPEQQPDLGAMPAFLREVQSAGFDLVIQMHGSGRITNHLIGFWGARRYAGFYAADDYCPDRYSFMEYPDDAPERWRHLRLMEFLGLTPQGDELFFPLRAQDWRELEELRQAFGFSTSYVCVHPGARKAERRWPAADFAAVADAIAALGYQVILTGSQDEIGLAREVAAHMTAPFVDLAGKTTLGGLGALLSGARLLFSNDTGVSHLAAALRTPSVVMFSASDHDRWAPANRQLHRIVRNAGSVRPPEALEEVRVHLESLERSSAPSPVPPALGLGT